MNSQETAADWLRGLQWHHISDVCTPIEVFSREVFGTLHMTGLLRGWAQDAVRSAVGLPVRRNNFVLCGPQGVGKTSFLRTLALGDRWYNTTSAPDSVVRRALVVEVPCGSMDEFLAGTQRFWNRAGVVFTMNDFLFSNCGKPFPPIIHVGPGQMNLTVARELRNAFWAEAVHSL